MHYNRTSVRSYVLFPSTCYEKKLLVRLWKVFATLVFYPLQHYKILNLSSTQGLLVSVFEREYGHKIFLWSFNHNLPITKISLIFTTLFYFSSHVLTFACQKTCGNFLLHTSICADGPTRFPQSPGMKRKYSGRSSHYLPSVSNRLTRTNDDFF